MISLMLITLFARFALPSPNPCTTPAQWEAIAILEYEGEFTVRGKLSYDATNKRERFLIQEIFGSESIIPTDNLNLYEQNIAYVFDLKTKICKKFTLDEPFVAIGVPNQVNYTGEVFIGSPAVSGVNIPASTWSYTYPNSGDPVAFFGMFSQPSCLPLRVGYESVGNGRLTYNFFDITPGIKDPTVFTPRPECANLQ